MGVVMAENKSNNLGGLGLTLWGITASHGVASKTRVWELAKEGGHSVSRQTVYNYLSGRKLAPRDFLRALDKALHFTDDEKRELVRAFSHEVRQDKDIREIVEAAETAFDLSDEERMKLGWVYLWEND